MPTEREETIVMAVDILVVSMFQTILARESAVKVLLPDETDSASAIFTAVTSVMGLLLAGRYNNAKYEEGVQHFARVLRLGQSGFREQAKKLAR